MYNTHTHQHHRIYLIRSDPTFSEEPKYIYFYRKYYYFPMTCHGLPRHSHREIGAPGQTFKYYKIFLITRTRTDERY